MSTNAIQAIMTNQIVSGLDVLAPEVWTKLIRARGTQGGEFFNMLRLMSAEVTTANVEFEWFEELWKHETAIVNAPASQGAPGGNIVFTLAPASVDADNNFYPRVNDVVFFKNEATGVIVDIDTTTPTAPVITVTPNGATRVIPNLAAGEEVVISSSAFGEGTDQPLGAMAKVEKLKSYTQIIKETLTYTGTSATDQTWLHFNGSNGLAKLPGDPYYFKGQEDLDYRMSAKISGALLWQEPTTNTILDPFNNSQVRTTQGFIPALRERGNVMLRVPGTFQVSDLDEMDRIFDREGAGRYVLALNGLNLNQEINNVLVDYFNGTNIQFAKQAVVSEVFGETDAHEALVNFKYLQKNDRCFMFRAMPEFTNPKLYGAPGYAMRNYGVFMPMGTTKVEANGKKIKNLTVRYKALGSYNRKSEVWSLGSVGTGQKLISVDKNNTFMRTDVGLMTVAANQGILLATQ